mgnify:CR=1 FL=1
MKFKYLKFSKPNTSLIHFDLDNILFSFDVVSIFPKVPLKDTLDTIEKIPALQAPTLHGKMASTNKQKG